MDINDYVTMVAKHMAAENQTQGQACWNVLFDYRPERAEEIRGTRLDPYYQHGARGEFWDEFYNWLETWMTG